MTVASRLTRMTAVAVLAASLLAHGAIGQTRPPGLVAQVRAALNARDFENAEALVQAERAAKGDTPELLAALSWLARSAQTEGRADRAEALAVEAQTRAVRVLAGRSADADANLATAIGAAIEVQALLGVDRGERSTVLAFLERELYAVPGRQRPQKRLQPTKPRQRSAKKSSGNGRLRG